MLDAKLLSEIFAYDRDRGEIRWKKRLGPRSRIGSLVGAPNSDGYLQVQIFGRKYKVHRVIWALETGKWPERLVDHIDMDVANNRFGNLRECNQSENKSNVSANANNKSGLKWVNWHNPSKMWAWKVCKDGKRADGRTPCPAASHLFAFVEAMKLHGEFTRAS